MSLGDGTTVQRLPEVGEHVRMVGTLVEVQNVATPAGQVADYIFEETSARLEARVNGKGFREFSTFNDFYGDGTGVASAISEARKQIQCFGDSDIEFVVVRITSQRRKRPVKDGSGYDLQFPAFESLNHECRRGLPDDIEVDVWSSTRGDFDFGQ